MSFVQMKEKKDYIKSCLNKPLTRRLEAVFNPFIERALFLF